MPAPFALFQSSALRCKPQPLLSANSKPRRLCLMRLSLVGRWFWIKTTEGQSFLGPGAENATLTFMVGGDDADFHRAEPLLKAMGKNIVHCGEAGTGTAVCI